ncbi:MAG: response regulator [Anaerolineae bacterium]|nr:response regulator [Anaerolineae bacterium]
MADSEIHILIVDNQREEARFLKTTLELLEHGFTIVDVPSGEEAMLEFIKPLDLIVTRNTLPGMSGLDLIRRAHRRHPTVKSILTVERITDDLRQQASEAGVTSLIEKPYDAHDVSSAVQQALFGERPGQASPAAQPSSDGEFGPIPPVDAAEVGRMLGPQMFALGARGVAFVNRKGEVLWRGGQFDDRVRFNELVVFLARNLTNSGTIASYIGQIPSTTMQYYDGFNYDLFSISVGVHFFVALVFDGDSQNMLGAVMNFRRKVIRDVIDYIGVDAVLGNPEGTWAAVKAGRVAAGAPEPEEEIAVPDVIEVDGAPVFTYSSAREEALARQAAQARAKAKAEPTEIIQVFELEEIDKDTARIDLDLGELESALGEGGEGLEDFWGAVEEEGAKIREDAISMDEAIRLGLMDDLNP